MKKIILWLFILYLPLLITSVAYTEDLAYLRNQKAKRVHSLPLPANTNLRGWEHLASRLYQEGVSIQNILAVYSKNSMPKFQQVSFSLAPKESRNIYRGFNTRKNRQAAHDFITKYNTTFIQAEKKYAVPAEIITSILLVESHFGRNTGKYPIIYRLSRLANISDPENLQYNYTRLKKADSKVTFQQVVKRAHYLEKTFLPEIIATMEVARQNNIDRFDIKGSSAGAFGWPQFLPSSYLKYSVDFDNDGRKSLFNPHDVIGSVANYFHQHGWGKKNPEAVVWKYNKSQAYVDTVLGLAKSLEY